MTPVNFYFVAPNGLPVASTVFTIRLSKSGYTEGIPGIALPKEITATTDLAGRVTVNLWASNSIYTAEIVVNDLGEVAVYRFKVPEVEVGDSVNLQEILVTAGNCKSNCSDEQYYLGPVAEQPGLVSKNRVIKSTNNALSVGPIEIALGRMVTVPAGRRWVLI